MRYALNALLGVLLLAGAGRAQTGPTARTLPASFEANQIFVHPVTAGGDTLRLFTDTGGSYLLYRSAVERLDLPVRDTTVRGRSTSVTVFPDLERAGSIPLITGVDPFVRSKVGAYRKIHPRADGLLGNAWFAGHVWTIDYAAEEMIVHAPSASPEAGPAHTVEMGFPTDSAGHRLSNFPSIEATIDGTTYPFLLDTGATFLLSEEGREALGRPGVRGGSYIVASVFRRWRREHPDWRVIEGGEMAGGGTAMIRVPELTIAGHTVGPVWFARRPDANFHQRMARWMDRPVDGALGGSLFRYFELTLDYPRSRAHFRRIDQAVR